MTDTNRRRSLGEELRNRQLHLRITQTEAAKRCGVTSSVYSRWLADLTLPSMGNVPGVAGFLEIDVAEVFALMPESYSARGPMIEMVELRRELAALRAVGAEERAQRGALANQIAELRGVIDHLTAMVDALYQPANGQR